MTDRKKERIRILRVKDTDDEKTIYAKALRAFTAADLQKFTEIEPGIPAEQVLAELEAIDREAAEKRRQRGGTKKRRKQHQEPKKGKRTQSAIKPAAKTRSRIMGERKQKVIRRVRVKDTDDLPTIYAKVRKSFTAADLQRYTEIEEGIPMEQVLTELKAIQREETQKRKKKKK
jgi:hypothetical protein